ncbi:MAG: glycine cleavage system aminomethyltransferase GcvT [Dehalococcoidales bacterium]|nr:glycine cleavage system aminomethyltransferase GcvT [Dehalococcoidales bacterium]
MSKTIFYEQHLDNNAKMVDFAGWDMPINYPLGIIKESNIVRNSSGFFDVSHMGRVEIRGNGAESFIDKILPIDINSLKIGSAKYTLLINEKKEILDDLIIYRFTDYFLLIINASNTVEDINWMQSVKGKEVEINNITSETGMLAIQGPDVIKIFNSILNNAIEDLGRYKFKNILIENNDIFVARTGYTGEDGVEIIFKSEFGYKIWELLINNGVTPCGLGARDLLRIEAGLHLYGHEITKKSNPIDIGLKRLLESESSKYINNDYIHSENIKKGLFSMIGLVVTDRGIPREENEIYYKDSVIGKVTSGTHSSTLRRSIAIGIVKKDFNIINNTVRIKVRDKFLNATITKLPFYKRSKK